ncbi:hypothetical protein A1O3_04185 [Capronia epimyces CBS 606.96]|uniref:Cytochrome P450 oxidoreductase n=1 Tax=Capronia epimyces CBS 606.96 TaxID=1182542 RepID=W9YD88_9EURO|nr:uncharacterized protein A1O3_04185 [Capronia epimyces CBS 606.96]EXJ87226.1 hypothetical protein A1O3_04185 [Capronia epimyces CBS 606.96]
MSLLQQTGDVFKAYFLPALLVLVVLHFAINRYGYGLGKIPGPFVASLTDFWRMFHAYTNKGHQDYLLHRKYNSPVLRVGPKTVAVASPDAVRVIYGWKPVYRKTQIYTTQSQLNSNGQLVENLASTMDEEKHTRLAKPVAAAYGMSTLVEFEPLVDSTSRTFVEQMEQRFARPTKECPLDRWLQMYAFDVIGELTFSKRIGFLETGQDVDQMMYHTGRFMEYTGVVGQVPNLDWYFRIKNPILHMLRPTSNILGFTLKQIREHQKSSHSPSDSHSGPRDFLTRFLEAREKYPDIVDEGLVHDYANTNVAGGSDTTAIILRTLVHQFVTQRSILDKVLGEIGAALRARQAPGDADPDPDPDADADMDRPITWAEGLKMTYYQACIKEALRFHPATAQILPRLVPAGGVELGGHYLPPGTVVGCNAWSVHRDPVLYGQDVDRYRPERWLEVSPDQARKMETSLLTFGAGKRACVGKNIAMLEITKFIPEFFRRFDVELVDPERWKITSTWLAVQSGLDVRLKVRPLESLLAE